MANEYVSATDLKVPLNLSDTIDDTWLGIVATAASRAVDTYCMRRFYADTAATARWFRPTNGGVVYVDDISTTTSLVVATDDNDDGTAETTWAATDYELTPLNGVRNNVSGWPYDTVRAVESRRFPCNRRASVSVTAKWGWATTPADVKQATYLLALEMFHSKDARGNVLGVSELGTTTIRANPRLAMLLNPYRRDMGVAG